MIETRQEGAGPSLMDRPSTLTGHREMAAALVLAGRALLAEGYRFTAVTPATHARVLARPRIADTLVEVFGWNRPFSRGVLPPVVFDALAGAGLLRRRAGDWISRVRYASIGDTLYAHGSFPTVERDAVFFGPDTYRFVNVLRRCIPRCGLLVDIGCGAGAGGLEMRGRAERVLLTDINPRALVFAEANARLAGATEVEVRCSDVLGQVDERPDVIVANPPYLADPLGRAYRDGGGERGTGLGQRIVAAALERLRPDGRLLLYTGAPVVGGVDHFHASVKALLRRSDVHATYEELDPDVFGDELDEPAYADVERIAVIALSVTKRQPAHCP
jgi:release factor glutamine methyltransferase